MPLLASPNEHHGKLARVRDRLGKDMEVAKKPLPAGDYCFDAHTKLIGIEVKWSMSDLLDSLKVVGEAGGPRLAVEVRKLSVLCDMAFLLVPPLRCRGDGKLYRDDGEVSGWDYNSVKGILTDCQLAGIFVDEWDGDIAQRIAQLYFTLTKEEHGWIKQRGRPDFVHLDAAYSEAIWALCAADGIGPVTAEALLRDNRSVTDVALMTLKELQTIKGIGPKGAKALHDMLNRKW